MLKPVDYQKYVKAQIHQSQRSRHRTRKRDQRRQWIYDLMQEHGVCGKSILCAGARDTSEMNFFRKLGYDAEGIDLSPSDDIIECDMSKMLAHPHFQEKEYDIVFVCDAIEHCIDLRGFIDGLNKICKKYLVCLCPSAQGFAEGVDFTYWDCARHKFMVDNDNLAKNLLETFEQFNIVTAQVVRNGKMLFFILGKKID